MINTLNDSVYPRICFVLPSGANKPSGGAKIVFEYAKRFSENNYIVTIGYCIPRNNVNRGVVYNTIKKLYYLFLYKIFRRYTPKSWFSLPINVKQIVLSGRSTLAQQELQDYDYICATAVETAYYISSSHKKLYYLIQGFEVWGGVTEEYVYNSYKLPLNKIVITKWLQKLVESVGEKARLIPNGLDFSYFELLKPIEERDSCHICMLFHENDEIKRISDSITALKKVKAIYPNLYVNIFGIPKRPKYLPDWFHYYQNPNKEIHNKILNDSSIFIAASSTEGMGLPPAEAMICGCAVVCTDIGGFSFFAKNNETALTFSVGDINEYTRLILYLIQNKTERIRIAKNGANYIHSFSWEYSFSCFRTYIEETK